MAFNSQKNIFFVILLLLRKKFAGYVTAAPEQIFIEYKTAEYNLECEI